MRPLLLAIVVAFAVPSPAQTAQAAPAPVEIVNLEQHLWTTMAEGEFATVRSLFAKDYIQVDERISAVDMLVVSLKHCKIQTYELRDLQVRILSTDSAMTAYHVVDTIDCGASDKPSIKSNDNNATTVWVRQPGTTRWLVQTHTEAPAKP